MTRRLAFNTQQSPEVRDKLRAGIQQLADAVRITLGPSGRVVMYEREFGDPAITKDGVTVARQVTSPDTFEDMASGFKLMWWGGKYCKRIKTDRKDITTNMIHKNWRATEEINKAITFSKLKAGKFIANRDRHWGKASVLKNFKTVVDV